MNQKLEDAALKFSRIYSGRSDITAVGMSSDNIVVYLNDNLDPELPCDFDGYQVQYKRTGKVKPL